MRGRTQPVMVRSYAAGVAKTRPDVVIVEEPMEIRLDDHLVTTTMRTPGHDFELAAGYLHSEGLLGRARVHDIRYCATGSAVDTEFNVVTVGTRGDAPPPRPRLAPTTASCGICGSDAISALTERLTPLPARAAVRGEVVLAVAAALRDDQPLFATTGSVHGAAAFDLDSGVVVATREDIGRHNATDKVVGRLLLDEQLPASNLGLFLSGRVSLELVQKAWAAGMPFVAAVGGPSSLAVATARAAGITLTAFVRDDRFNVYAGEVA